MSVSLLQARVLLGGNLEALVAVIEPLLIPIVFMDDRWRQQSREPVPDSELRHRRGREVAGGCLSNSLHRQKTM